MEHFDLIIIGSGSGNAIPQELADSWRIAIVEKGVFGGTCLNVGCIPSKMFILPADVAESARLGPRLGVHSSVTGVDWPSVRDRVFGRIDPIAAGGRDYRAEGNPNVTLIEGTARFVGERSFDVDGRTISSDRVLLAAGARPQLPPIEGLDAVPFHTSDSVMRLDELPKRLAVIGGGFIAVELSHVFAAYGSDVTIFNRSDRLLRKHDDDASQRFTEVLGRRLNLQLNTVPTKVETSGTSGAPTVLVTYSDADGNSQTGEFDQLLVATGRRPNSDLLDAAAGGVSLHADGRVAVDSAMATSAPGVWAIGDLANSFQLKHLANKEADVAFWNLAHPQDQRHVDTSSVPYAVFSDPQMAGVGLTERAAQEQGLDYVVGRRDYAGTAYGWALEDTESFAKVLVEVQSKKILGAHILGPQAATLIQPLIQAMALGTPADVLARDIFYIHPALTEVVENALLEALDQLESGLKD